MARTERVSFPKELRLSPVEQTDGINLKEMDHKIKSDYWLINVSRVVECKVAFEEALTEEEALESFASGIFEDITDEYTVSEEVHDTAQLIGD